MKSGTAIGIGSTFAWVMSILTRAPAGVAANPIIAARIAKTVCLIMSLPVFRLFVIPFVLLVVLLVVLAFWAGP